MAHHRRQKDTGAGLRSSGYDNDQKYDFYSQMTPLTVFKMFLALLVAVVCLQFVMWSSPISPSQTFSTSSISFDHAESTSGYVNKTMVQFETAEGSFIVELFPNVAPQTVAHFKKLVHEGYYAQGDTGFYRAEAGFVLQGGAFLHEKQTPDGKIPVEYHLPSTERMVVLARNKAGTYSNSEFAIMLADNTLVNQPVPEEGNPGYTAFGRIYEGYTTVIARIVRKIPKGFMQRKDKRSAVTFKSVKSVKRIVPTQEKDREVFFRVKDEIETPFVAVVFSKSYCPHCKNAKALLKQLGAEVHAIELDLLPDEKAYQDVLEKLTGQRTVPNIFMNGVSIGGNDDAKKLHAQGKLKDQIQTSGAGSKAFVQEMIQKHPVVVFSKSYCPFCAKMKEYLKTQKAKHQVIEIDLRSDGKAIQYQLEELTKQRTVPNTFIQGKSIGGYDDAKKLIDSGQMATLLRNAGAL